MVTSEQTVENDALSPMSSRPEPSTSQAIRESETAETAGSNSSNTNSTASAFTVASTLGELNHIIDNCPLIDNHGHPLLEKRSCAQLEAVGANLLQVLTEADANSLKDVPTTLAYYRAIQTLQKDFPCLSNNGNDGWENWKKFRDDTDETDFTKICLAGLQTILLDDGIDFPDKINGREVSWHSQFLKSPARRIVRLEHVAEGLMKNNQTFAQWDAEFKAAVRAAIRDPEVAGFKSIICYNDGLGITYPDGRKWVRPAPELYRYEFPKDGSIQGMREIAPNEVMGSTINDWVVHVLAHEMTAYVKEGFPAKPLQFHTGFGDTDLRLAKADPSLLQDFIERFPLLPIVLLHASYPFTRQAGYLASSYKNVYLDFGLIWPKLSQEGQESVLRQVLELTPSSKAMWSTDGVYYGETYYLAIQQSREVLKTVLAEIHSKGNASLPNLSNIVTDILFNTANRIYNLDLQLTIQPPSASTSHHRTENSKIPATISNMPGHTNHRGLESLRILKAFLAKHRDIEYIRLNWLDHSAILRTRILKVNHVIKQLEDNVNGSVIGVAKAALYLLANCYIAPGGSPIGEWRLVPDFASLRLHPHKHTGEKTCKHATAMCWIEDEEQSPIAICPRNILATALSRADAAGLRNFKVGFEVEFCMFKQADLDNGKLVPITSHHTWSTSRAFQTQALDILEDIDSRLADAGIKIEQFHSEAAQGQFELILAPLPPMQAVDNLLHAREVIQYVCAQYGYRGSVSPKPFDGEPGSASHMHISFQPVDKQWSFFAGVLDEIRAVNALTLGSEMSYDRIIEGYWAGGVWACWGRQHREAPLRLVEEEKAHWEVKTMDGLANAYLAVAGVISAGTIGVEEQREIYGEADDLKSTSNEHERQKRGIKTRMASCMKDALDALFKEDTDTPTKFANRLGPGVAEHVRVIKVAEREHLLSQFETLDANGKPDVIGKRVWAAQWY
ncbi:hypothetical protein Dda_1657 [Drechslerella dactyloides]|uniref:Glutamine synthetase n=1 Tax=Drechslerella dactyloides TaxID=74499 RepID=A0AAD6J236_DREDA|nr:hypothetical protein Dda_1657 [Drechslerella dactyloides]